MRLRRTLSIGVALMSVLVLGAQGAAALGLNGAGATFPAPIYMKWNYQYNQEAGVQVNYQAIGSGGGIQQLTNHTVDFAGSDAIMTETQMAAVRQTVFHLPAVMGAVVVAYNVPGLSDGLKLTPKVLADIFLGTVTRWNDPAIAELNPVVNLPDMAINVVHRSDGSGTTNIFSNYLSKVSLKWATVAGSGTALNWPCGVGGKGNDGVAGVISQVPGSIGYVEMAYATQNHINYARIKNRAGNYPDPSEENIMEAAKGALAKMPSDFRIMFVNAPGANSYPICGFTWLLVYAEYSNANQGKAVVDYLNWIYDKGEGMKDVKELHYAPLPDSLITKVKAKIAQIKY